MTKKLKLKGRVADALVRSEGFTGGFKQVSLVEMDFSKDEQEYINEVLFDEKK
jgi:hypothetical protein